TQVTLLQTSDLITNKSAVTILVKNKSGKSYGLFVRSICFNPHVNQTDELTALVAARCEKHLEVVFTVLPAFKLQEQQSKDTGNI
uniref:Uncharacterized protein n=1 Tax=Nothobranchius furzeri TaxID=105023 RepID=A0A8C6LUZ4_NOTFU